MAQIKGAKQNSLPPPSPPPTAASGAAAAAAISKGKPMLLIGDFLRTKPYELFRSIDVEHATLFFPTGKKLAKLRLRNEECKNVTNRSTEKVTMGTFSNDEICNQSNFAATARRLVTHSLTGVDFLYSFS